MAAQSARLAFPSADVAERVSLALDGSGNPSFAYVVVSNVSNNGGKASVIKFSATSCH